MPDPVAEDPEEGVRDDVRACPECLTRPRNKYNNVLACSERHQCSQRIPAGRCSRARQPGRPFCTSHDRMKPNAPKWNGRVVAG